MLSRSGCRIPTTIALVSLATFAFTGCASAPSTPDTMHPALVIPPGLNQPPTDEDLSAPALPADTASYSGYLGQGKDQGAAVLPQPVNAKLERAGGQRWLVVNATPEQVWPVVHDFFTKNGLPLVFEDAKIGVMETDWVERSAAAQNGFLQKLFGLTAAPGIRDKFRARLERGTTPGTTEIYLSDRGLSAVGTQWQARDSDPEVEAQMLTMLMLQVGIKAEQATQTVQAPATSHARLDHVNGKQVLVVLDEFDRAWRRVGLALDRTGLMVEDRDRSKGIYYVRYNKANAAKPGFWGRLFHRKTTQAPGDVRYQIALKPAASSAEVRVLDKNGAEVDPATSERIVGSLYQQLK